MSEGSGVPTLRWAWLGTVGYQDAWELQRTVALARRSGELHDDAVLLLEHPPVYTMGRQGEARHLGEGSESLIAAGAEFLEVDRGGSVTFHGPGQLVAYPIVRLAGIFPIPRHPAHGDVDHYLRALEAALIATAATYGVEVTRRPPYTGVWTGNDKLGAIGVKLAGGVTSHGVALNVATDLALVRSHHSLRHRRIRGRQPRFARRAGPHAGAGRSGARGVPRGGVRAAASRTPAR